MQSVCAGSTIRRPIAFSPYFFVVFFAFAFVVVFFAAVFFAAGFAGIIVLPIIYYPLFIFLSSKFLKNISRQSWCEETDIPYSKLKRPCQDGHGAAGLRLLLLPSGPGRVGRRLLAWFLAGARIRYNDYREKTRG